MIVLKRGVYLDGNKLIDYNAIFSKMQSENNRDFIAACVVEILVISTKIMRIAKRKQFKEIKPKSFLSDDGFTFYFEINYFLKKEHLFTITRLSEHNVTYKIDFFHDNFFYSKFFTIDESIKNLILGLKLIEEYE